MKESKDNALGKGKTGNYALGGDAENGDKNHIIGEIERDKADGDRASNYKNENQDVNGKRMSESDADDEIGSND